MRGRQTAARIIPGDQGDAFQEPACRTQLLGPFLARALIPTPHVAYQIEAAPQVVQLCSTPGAGQGSSPLDYDVFAAPNPRNGVVVQCKAHHPDTP